MRNTMDVKISLPKRMVADLDNLLYDPVRGKPRYGGRSKIIRRLLQNWMVKEKLRRAEIQEEEVA